MQHFIEFRFEQNSLVAAHMDVIMEAGRVGGIRVIKFYGGGQLPTTAALAANYCVRSACFFLGLYQVIYRSACAAVGYLRDGQW